MQKGLQWICHELFIQKVILEQYWAEIDSFYVQIKNG